MRHERAHGAGACIRDGGAGARRAAGAESIVRERTGLGLLECKKALAAVGGDIELAIEELRNRQVKNFLTTTMLALGVPMINMGDEVRRTQLGNNNAYCLDNEENWFDWTLPAKHADVLRFTQLLIARRLPALPQVVA